MSLLVKTISLGLSSVLIVSPVVYSDSLDHPSWQLSVGGTVMQAPVYLGADDYKTQLIPALEGYFAVSESLSFFVQNYALGMDIGVSASMHLGLLTSVQVERLRADSDDLEGMDNIDEAETLGAYVSYQFGNNVQIIASALSIESDDDERWLSDISASKAWPMAGSPFELKLSSQIAYASESFNQRYYGVLASQARTQRTTYTLGAGWYKASVDLEINYRFNPQWRLVSTVGISHLLGEVADSPLVKEKTQITPQLGIRYDF